MSTEIIDTVDNYGISVADIKELGIKNFELDKDDLFLMIEDTIRERMAHKLRENLVEMSGIYKPVFHQRAEYFVERFGGTLTLFADALDTDLLPLELAYSYQRAFDRTQCVYLFDTPSVDELLNSLQRGVRRNTHNLSSAMSDLGLQVEGFIADRSEGNWKVVVPNSAGALKELRHHLQSTSGYQLHMSTSYLQYATGRNTVTRALGDNVTCQEQQDTRVRYTLETPPKDLKSLTPDAESDETQNRYWSLNRECDRIIRAVRDLNKTMSRTKSRVYKSLIKGAGAADDDRAGKLSHLILSIAQKPLDMLNE